MGLGIYEPKSGTHVPGTATLYDDQATAEAPSRMAHLRHGTGKDSELLLVPQPSNSPNDPLNWPLWKKDLTLFILCFAAAVSGVLAPAIAPINKLLVEEFHTTYQVTAKFAGWQFWPAAIAGLVGSAVGRVWGKRPVYVASVVILLVGAVWNALAQDVNSFLGARMLQGFGLGAFETIVPSSIGDMYFVHQRGKRVALYNLTFLGCTFFMPVLGGIISMRHGWRTQFQIISAFLVPVVVLVVLFVPEHAYNRPAIFNTDLHSEDKLSDLDEQLARANELPSTQASTAEQEGKSKTFVQELKLYNGRFTDESFFKLLLAPFVLFLYPATLWAFSFQGTFITWGIAVSVVLAQMFAGPPTFFTPAQLGYMYAAPTIGALTAYAMGFFLSDTLTRRLARANKNTYEPEFRILMVIPVAMFGLPGLYAYGHVSEMHTNWFPPSVLYALLTFAVVTSCTVTFSYILDAHRDVAIEMMVSVLVLKNMFAFGSTFFLVDWVEDQGPERVFYVLGGVQTGVCLASVGMYVGGKKMREVMARWGLLRRAGLYPKGGGAVVVG